MSVILVEMLARKGKTIRPEDVAAAVLKHGADEARRDMVRLMAEDFQKYGRVTQYEPGSWEPLA